MAERDPVWQVLDFLFKSHPWHERTGRAGIVGDGDPMDICVLTEKTITHGDILVRAIPIGGPRMIDGNEADDSRTFRNARRRWSTGCAITS
jgi:inorganic pyrophosphatase